MSTLVNIVAIAILVSAKWEGPAFPFAGVASPARTVKEDHREPPTELRITYFTPEPDLTPKTRRYSVECKTVAPVLALFGFPKISTSSAPPLVVYDGQRVRLENHSSEEHRLATRREGEKRISIARDVSSGFVTDIRVSSVDDDRVILDVRVDEQTASSPSYDSDGNGSLRTEHLGKRMIKCVKLGNTATISFEIQQMIFTVRPAEE